MLGLTVAVSGAAVEAGAIVRPLSTKVTGRIVIVQFYGGGQIDKAGRGIAIVDAGGESVPFRIVSHDAAGRTSLAVDLRAAGAGPFRLRYGTDPDPQANVDASLPASLVLRTFGGARAPMRNPSAMLRHLDRAKPLGTALIPNVYLAHNPFGADHHFVTDVQGLIRVSDAGTYRLFSFHDDAALVLIDGKVVIQQLAASGSRDSAAIERTSTAVSLSAGEHALRYVHLQREGATAAVLGIVRDGRAVPLPRSWYVHHAPVRLGPARRDDGPAIGFDVEQMDRLAHGGWIYTRFRLRAIAPAPAGAQYRWRFGDGVTRAGKAEVVHVAAGAGEDQPVAMRLELVDSAGVAQGNATAVVRPSMFADIESSDRVAVRDEYAHAISEARYDDGKREALAAYYQLAALPERPVLTAPVAEAYLGRFGRKGGLFVASMKMGLAAHLARDDPGRAAELYGEVARFATGTARDETAQRARWMADRAAAEQLDLMIFRLGRAEQVPRKVRAMVAGRSPRGIALLKSKLGDVHRFAGDAEKALAAYRAAQRAASRRADRRRSAVLESAHRETALSLLTQRRYPALRAALLRWEADFPEAKLGGDLSLLTGRYFQAIGDPARAEAEYRTILKLSPNHPNAPEFLFRHAECLDELGRADEAATLRRRLKSTFPNHPMVTW
ncbi:MAG: hypothetical protein CMJ18_24870 [Phycisphaeraceae bacterium]|nr:hypothetical protein [Phycisphaeraceae bacterium]